MVAAEPRNRPNGHVPEENEQLPSTRAPDAPPDDSDTEAERLRGSMLLGAYVEAPPHAEDEVGAAAEDDSLSPGTLIPEQADQGSEQAESGSQWVSDDELAAWIARSADRERERAQRSQVGWRWLLYMVAVGPLLLVGLVFTAMARALLPSHVPVWGFERRSSALGYLLAVGGVASVAVIAILLASGGVSFGGPATDAGVGKAVAPPVQRIDPPVEQQTDAPSGDVSGNRAAASSAATAGQAPTAPTTAGDEPVAKAPVIAPAQSELPSTAAGDTPPVARPSAAAAGTRDLPASPSSTASEPAVSPAVVAPATSAAPQQAETAAPETTATTRVDPPTDVTSPAPVAQPSASSPEASPAVAKPDSAVGAYDMDWVIVANSGGSGVFLRPKPDWGARWAAEPGETQRDGAYPHHGSIAWREGTRLQVSGLEISGSGPQPGSSEGWLPVRDPVGREGYMPKRYLQRVAAGALALPAVASQGSASGQETTQFVVVSETGGTGVFLRPRPEWSARWPASAGQTKEQGAWWHHGWVAWLDGTRLSVRGQNVEGTGPRSGDTELWVPVRDPVGREGYVPQRFLGPVS